MSEFHDHHHASGLDAAVVARIFAELGAVTGERVLDSLRTASALLQQSSVDDRNLRFAASVAYNLREALDSIVRGRPAGNGGLATVMEAWRLYKLKSQFPGGGEAQAWVALARVLDDLANDEHRQAHMTRRLLGWFQEQTGVDPLPGSGDPTVRYQKLRETAARMLHGDPCHVEVQALFSDVVEWFDRFFAPPSHINRSIEHIASQEYSATLMAELRAAVMNSHHLRLFFECLQDPAWLEPLREEGLIGLPAPGAPWPVTAFTGERCRLAKDVVADLLDRLLEDLNLLPKDDRPGPAWEIARAASWLGAPGMPVVIKVLRVRPTDDWIQMISVSAVKEVDPADPVHLKVADAVVGNEPRQDRGYRTEIVLRRLFEGMTQENVQSRFELIAAKARRFSREQLGRHLFIDVAALSVEGDDASEPALHVARYLARVVPVARSLGLPSSSMLKQVAPISGELGERLVCQILASADDLDRSTRIAHVVGRLASERATGDDMALIDQLSPFDALEVEQLKAALGTPIPHPAGEALSSFGDNWVKGWRWSSILPDAVLSGWESAIAAVTQTHGEPDQSAFEKQAQTAGALWGSSPFSVDELSALDVIDAARAIANWRPSGSDPWGVSARELARSLEAVVKQQPSTWTRDAATVVRSLREPVYIQHYFRAVADSAKAVVSDAAGLLAAIGIVAQEQWEVAAIGADDFDYEEDWDGVASAGVELVGALANADADLRSQLEQCWILTGDLMADIPADPRSVDHYRNSDDDHDDPLNRAINCAYGKKLLAVLALGAWEHRSLGSASGHLVDALTEAMVVDGGVGLELRSILAMRRPLIEAIASDWMALNHLDLFGGDLGRISLSQTLRYSRPTKAFYSRSVELLLGAAREGDDRATSWLLIAHLWGEPGYTFDRVIEGLAQRNESLVEVGREISRVLVGIPTEQLVLVERGVAFWAQLLAETGRRIPVSTLEGLGGWALVGELDQSRWLDLTEQTVRLTGGRLEHATEVAERCRDAQPSPMGLRILASLLGHGEPWDQRHIEATSTSALTAAAEAGLTGPAFTHLQERLVQRGQHRAASIKPKKRS